MPVLILAPSSHCAERLMAPQYDVGEAGSGFVALSRPAQLNLEDRHTTTQILQVLCFKLFPACLHVANYTDASARRRDTNACYVPRRMNVQETVATIFKHSKMSISSGEYTAID